MIDEIERMLDSGDMDDHKALRLILRSVALLHLKMDSQRVSLDSMEDRIESLERYQRDYPSLPWMARYRTREVIVIIIIILLVSQIIIPVADMTLFRQFFLSLVGLPSA